MHHAVVADAVQQQSQSDTTAETDVGGSPAARNIGRIDGGSFPRLSTRATIGLRIPCGRPSCPATVDNSRSLMDVMGTA
jgi:hypothetical protein